MTTSGRPIATLSNTELMDEIASYGVKIPAEDLSECLRWADWMFTSGRLLSTDRNAAEALLAKLRTGS